MVNSFDPRILQIGVEVNGVLRVYTDGDLSVKINRSADGKQNTCDAIITNLTPEVRNYLLTETSPWKANRQDKILTVIAGRQAAGTQRIYTGAIASSSVSDRPDVRLMLKALTSDNLKYTFTSRQSPPTIALSKLCQQVAGDYGCKLRFEATDKTIANYLYNGTVARQINHLALVGDVDAFIDNDVMVVKNLGVANKGQARVLSEQTQMIGAPLIDDKGVKVRMLYDPTVNLGDAIEIQSVTNPAANGQYTIYNMAISLSTRAQDWYADLSCNNANIRSILKKREAEAKKKAKADAEAKKK